MDGTGEIRDRSVQRLIISHRFQDAESRLRKFPEEAFETSGPLNETALATACRVKASADLIAALVAANPDAATQRLRTGKTPLHLWCSDMRRTSRGVGFEDDVAGVEAILKARPEAAKISDGDGWLPLHCACASASSAPVSIFRYLISAFPRSVLIRNKGGVTPLEMLWDRSALNVEDGRCILSVEAARLHERAAELERMSAARAYNRSADVRPLGNSAATWSKILLMAKAAYHGALESDLFGCENTISTSAGHDLLVVGECGVEKGKPRQDDIFRPLHALAGIDCPTSMIEFAIKVHSRDPGALDEVDRGGNMPLHVACSRKCQPIQYDSGQSNSNRAGSIIALLESFPRAAQINNAGGRVPLSLAIESGAAWEGGVKQLFERSPEELTRRDSGLYPFQLAASVGSTEVSYMLLKHNPGIII